MTHTFFDQHDRPHTLDLDLVRVDDVPCVSVQSDERLIRFETTEGAVMCGLDRFWHDIAGPDLDAHEAGVLLAECLSRQILLQRQAATLSGIAQLLAQAPGSTASSLSWLSVRLDPLARQAMSAYDGSEAMTEMLARILHQSPATIHQWAHQLGLNAPAPDIEVTTEPLPAVETLVEAESRERFFWSPERSQELAAALETCTGSTVAERARQIASEHGWPETSVRSKLYEMQRPRRAGQQAARETECTEAEKEDDQRADQLVTNPI